MKTCLRTPKLRMERTTPPPPPLLPPLPLPPLPPPLEKRELDASSSSRAAAVLRATLGSLGLSAASLSEQRRLTAPAAAALAAASTREPERLPRSLKFSETRPRRLLTPRSKRATWQSRVRSERFSKRAEIKKDTGAEEAHAASGEELESAKKKSDAEKAERASSDSGGSRHEARSRRKQAAGE